MRGRVMVQHPWDFPIVAFAQQYCESVSQVDTLPSDAPLVFTSQHTLNTLAPTADRVVVSRVIDITDITDDTVTLWQRVIGGIQRVRVELPVVLGVLPSALPVVSFSHGGALSPQQAYTPPPRETVMLPDTDSLAALLHDLTQQPNDPRITVVEDLMPDSEPPPLADAPIVVGVGKGVGFGRDKSQPFAERVRHSFAHVLTPFADELSAALAASRAVIDSAGIEAVYQVGQSGKSIAPDVYVAVGISGAVQHLQGVQHSRLTIAINSDPDAPIFHTAHYGIVGEANEIIRAVTAQLA